MATIDWDSDSDSENQDLNQNPRPLTTDEILDIVNGIQNPNPKLLVQENTTHIHREKLRRKLETVKIKSVKIPDLKRIILQQYYSSLVAPGEAAGVNAAQCIGEPTTQSTLNTFHHTGISKKNVTLGFQLARELFNATHSPSNPSCTIFFKKNNQMPSELHTFVDHYPEATIDQLLVNWSIIDADKYQPNTYWHKLWTSQIQVDFGTITDDWCLRLNFDINKLYEHQLTLRDICSRLEAVYTDLRCIPSPLNLGVIDVLVKCSEISITSNRNNELLEIQDDFEARKFYMTSIVAPKLRSHTICGIPNISAVYRRKVACNEPFGKLPLKTHIAKKLRHKEEWIVETDGSNLRDILVQPGVDTERTVSNNMWEILEIFGIEAVRQFLFLAFMNLVTSGGANINPVHIDQLVDKMTCTGNIRAIARFGVETSQYGPLARSTFEEVMSQLMSAAIFSERDDLNALSSSIMAGTQINAGTGRVWVDNHPELDQPPVPTAIICEDI
jgi:DNA-directed RNA polymerase II subunit RPB1